MGIVLFAWRDSDWFVAIDSSLEGSSNFFALLLAKLLAVLHKHAQHEQIDRKEWQIEAREEGLTCDEEACGSWIVMGIERRALFFVSCRLLKDKLHSVAESHHAQEANVENHKFFIGNDAFELEQLRVLVDVTQGKKIDGRDNPQANEREANQKYPPQVLHIEECWD